MTLREKAHERIDQMDDAALFKLIEQLDAIEQEDTVFSKEFKNTLKTVHERNKDLSGEEALKLATEAVKAHRQERRR